MTKGAIIEFDFTAANGADLLYETTRRLLAKLDGIEFNPSIEAKYLMGGNYQGGIADYFTVVKTKKTAAKAAKDLETTFLAALNEAAPQAVTDDFRAFVKTLEARDVKCVIATRADLDLVRGAFEGILSDKVILYREESVCYGTVKWDSWRRACAACSLPRLATIAVTGSGLGVRSALVAGLGSLAVINDHVAYQDFGGADAVVEKLDAAAAQKVIDILRI